MTNFIHRKGCCVKSKDSIVISELFFGEKFSLQANWLQKYTHDIGTEI